MKRKINLVLVFLLVLSYVLNYKDDVYTLTIFASDVNYDLQDKKAIESYEELYKGSQEFLKSFIIKN